MERTLDEIKGMVVLAFVLRAASAEPMAERQDAAGQVAQEMALFRMDRLQLV